MTRLLDVGVRYAGVQVRMTVEWPYLGVGASIRYVETSCLAPECPYIHRQLIVAVRCGLDLILSLMDNKALKP